MGTDISLVCRQSEDDSKSRTGSKWSLKALGRRMSFNRPSQDRSRVPTQMGEADVDAETSGEAQAAALQCWSDGALLLHYAVES